MKYLRNDQRYVVAGLLVDRTAQHREFAMIGENLTSRLPYLINQFSTKRAKQRFPNGISPEQATEIITKLAPFDPTGEKNSTYMPYIVAQFIAGQLRLEDGIRLRDTLAFFHRAKLKKTFVAAGGKTDINQYPRWKEIEELSTRFVDPERETAAAAPGQEEFLQGARIIFEFENPRVAYRFRVLEISEPEAAVIYGRDTLWCTARVDGLQTYGKQTEPPPVPQFNGRPMRVVTSKSANTGEQQGYAQTAAGYMSNGPLYIIQRAPKAGGQYTPYVQATHDFRQFMDISDKPMRSCQPGFDLFLGALAESLPGHSQKGIGILRNRCTHPNYPGRPPILNGDQAPAQAPALVGVQEDIVQDDDIERAVVESTTAPARPVTKPVTTPKPISPFNPPKPRVLPKPKANTGTPTAPAKPKTKPLTKPFSPFNPPKPKVTPRPKATVDFMVYFFANSVMKEAYEDEAHPNVQSFWRDLPQSGHAFSQHPILSKHGHDLSQSAYNYVNQRRQQQGAANPQQIFMQILRLEAQHQDQLVELAKEVTARIWGIDKNQLNGELTTQIDLTPSEPDQNPEEQEEPEITPEGQRQINKRLSMNTMTQGAAVHQMQTMHHLVDQAINAIDPRLLQLYTQLATGSVHQYWLMDIPNILGNLANMKAGEERVDFPEGEEGQPTVMAQAVCFPVLCQELSKGVMELLTMHHLSSLDEPTARAVVHHADKLEHEPWQIQVGPELWRRFLSVIPRKVNLSELVAKFSQLDPDEVHDILEKVISNPEHAREILGELMRPQWTDSPPDEPEFPDEEMV